MSKLCAGSQSPLSKLWRRVGATAATHPGVLNRLGIALVLLNGLFLTEQGIAQEHDSSTVSLDSLNRPYMIPGSILDDEMLLRKAESGLFKLYNMEYGPADSIFSSIERLHPEHPIGAFLRGLVLWWRILPELESGGKTADKAFYKAMEEVLKRSERLAKRDRGNFDAKFFAGAAYGFRGRLLSNRRSWLNAASDGKKALNYIFDVADTDSTIADLQFGVGVYNYFATAIPRQYPIVKPMLFFFPKADREKGLASLEFTATEGRLIRTEAAYFLLQIYLFYEPDFEKSVRYATWLTRSYPENAFFRLLEARVYVRWGQWSRAMISIEKLVTGHSEHREGYSDALAAVALYYEGRYHMQEERLDEAAAALIQVESLSVKQPNDSFYKVNAQLRLGMIHDAKGERELALAAYRRVLSMKDHGNAHDQARRYSKESYRRQ